MKNIKNKAIIITAIIILVATVAVLYSNKKYREEAELKRQDAELFEQTDSIIREMEWSMEETKRIARL
jgi:hypothetical protein